MGWRIGRVAGIDLRLHWSFLLLLGWIAVVALLQGQGWDAVVASLALVAAVFGCVILHELGHALAARQFGIATRDITLLPIGGLARLERLPQEPRRELWIALAGPLVNVVLAGLLWMAIVAAGFARGAVLDTLGVRTEGGFLGQLMWVNVWLFAFNLLPAFPMDGGRVLRALLAMRMDYARATELAAGIGQAVAVLFAIGGLFINPFLLLVALLVFVTADTEAKDVQLESALRGLCVGHAMMTDFQVLQPDDSVRSAAQLLLAGSQQDFPVADRAGVRGVLTRRDIVAALGRKGKEMVVAAAMTPIEEPLTEQVRLSEAMQRMRELGGVALPVVRSGRMVGLLSGENIGELLMLRAARNGERVPEVEDARAA